VYRTGRQDDNFGTSRYLRSQDFKPELVLESSYFASRVKRIPTSEVEFTVVSLPETSRLLSNAIHCPVFHRIYIYLTLMVFLFLSFLLQQLMTVEGRFVYIFLFFHFGCVQFLRPILFRQEKKLVGAKLPRTWRFALNTAD
jgi:hypothetical protein